VGALRAALLLLAAALVLATPALGSTPSVEARAYLVQSGTTGETLLAHRARERVPVASITKLMTVLVALDRAPLGDIVTVSPAATGITGSTIHLRAGERITVRDLVKAALIQSANDAANALALHVGRGDLSSFVALMNKRARELGLHDTHFTRAEGLDAPGHVSSARDVTVLARVAMQRPFVRSVVRLRSATIAGGRRLHTWNDLLARFPGLLGVKTGHTAGAGWSEVAAARRPGVTVYATVLGSPTRSQRNDDLAELLAWGLARYRLVELISRERTYARVETQYGRPPVRLVAATAVSRVVRVDRRLVEHVTAPAVVALPVRRGARLGEVRVYERGELVARVPLLAGSSVARPDLAGRVRWYAGRTVDRIGGWIT
jgi:D-alanyl-D-alanine carboxypeptidase (penicillin-binding protein 5/6)